MLLVQCADNNSAVGSDTDGMKTISGMLRCSDGTPAAGITVHLRNRLRVAILPSSGSAKTVEKNFSAVTDNEGAFTFGEKPQTGIYVAEARNAGKGVLIDSLVVDDNGDNMVLDPATLEPTGAIRGTVSFTEKTDAASIYLLIFGLNRYVSIKSDGSFLFPDLPGGTYDLRFIATGGINGTRDTGSIDVHPAETTVVDVALVPCEATPAPQALTASYDTLRQCATLTWQHSSAMVQGYNVYRRNVDSNSTFADPLNYENINDTVYVDMACVQDNTYEYRVAAIRSDGVESVKSNDVTIYAASYFETDTVFRIPTDEDRKSLDIMDVAVSDDNELFLLVANDQSMHVYDTAMNLLRTIPCNVMMNDGDVNYPTEMHIGREGTLYFLTMTWHAYNDPRTTIYRQNSTGTEEIILSFAENTRMNCNGQTLFTVYDSTLEVHSEDGTLLETRILKGVTSEGLTVIPGADCIVRYGFGTTSSVTIFDSLGNKTGAFVPLPGFSIHNLEYDEGRERLYLSGTVDIGPLHTASLHVADRNGTAIASYRLPVPQSTIGSDLKVFIATSSTGSVFIIIQHSFERLVVKLKPLLR